MLNYLDTLRRRASETVFFEGGKAKGADFELDNVRRYSFQGLIGQIWRLS